MQSLRVAAPTACVRLRRLVCRYNLGALLIIGLTGIGRVARADTAQPPRVYGADDRREYFELADPEARRTLSESVIALIAKRRLGDSSEPFPTTPTWGDVDQLCPDEPFRDQPAIALCTGVLADWDLVLTAGHCARAISIDDMAVVFDYAYEAPGELRAKKSDVLGVKTILAEALDGQGVEPRLDYAWLRLEKEVGAERRPVPIYRQSPPALVGDAIFSMGTGGGAPIKFDAGGRIRDLREGVTDYFVADVDSSHGSSGAAAFTKSFALLGILARGGIDFDDSPAGCRTTRRVSEDLAEEHFTYAHRALTALCEKNPEATTLCRPQCAEPCQASARIDLSSAGCSMATSSANESCFGPVFMLGLTLLLCHRKSARMRDRQ
jgi:Trypsin-like peptidase domain